MPKSTKHPPRAFAEGRNYRFDLAHGIATCRVWMRPDLDREGGAECARECADIFAQVVGLSKLVAGGGLLDLRDAPRSWGPITQTALERSLALFEAAGRPIAVVTSSDALQMLHVRLLVKEQAWVHGRPFTDLEKARGWLAAKASP